MNTFDEIYVLDLHGNSLKKERCPDGSKDENVFDIRQGVAIAFFIKHLNSSREEKTSSVFHAEHFGLREQKYDWLNGNDWAKTDWEEIHPHSEFYLFIQRDEQALARYEKFIRITDIFPVNSVGIVTSRDRFVIDFEKETLKRRIRTFLDPSLPDDFVRETFKLKNTQSWKLAEKRKKIQQDDGWEKKIVPCLYRPFDVRWLFYHSDAIERGREEVMRHMLADNLALITARSNKSQRMDHFLCSSHIVETKCGESTIQSYTFPLYLCSHAQKGELFTTQSTEERVCNLSSEFLKACRTSCTKQLTPEEIFAYIYAILYSNVYRDRYAEFLRIDFPRIPLTSDHELFDELAALGKRLVDLHLLRSDELDPPIAKFEGDGDGIVQTGKNGLRYEPQEQRVFINKTQYFEGIPPQVWEYQIGGYQVCHKWLKDRKNRHLSLDEIKTYCQIVTSLAKTIEIQTAIDELYPTVEETLLAISSE
jgi:predicted helicase